MGYLIVGRKRKCYAVHPDVISTSGMNNIHATRETDSGRRGIVLRSWKENEAARLVEWLYSNDYSSPTPTLLGPGGPKRLTEEKCVNPCYMLQTDINHLSTQSDTSKQPLRNLDFGPSRAGGLAGGEVFKLWAMQHSSQPPQDMDYGPTMLCHAKLYVKAYDLSLDNLMGHAFRRLQAVLLSISHVPKDSLFVFGFKTLIKYVYKKTTWDSNDQMRNLLSTFMAMHVDSLDVRLENAAILRDVLGKIQQLNLLGEKEVIPFSKAENSNRSLDDSVALSRTSGDPHVEGNGQDNSKRKVPLLHCTDAFSDSDISSDDEGNDEPWSPNLDGSHKEADLKDELGQLAMAQAREASAPQVLENVVPVHDGTNVHQSSHSLVKTAPPTQTSCSSNTQTSSALQSQSVTAPIQPVANSGQTNPPQAYVQSAGPSQSLSSHPLVKTTTPMQTPCGSNTHTSSASQSQAITGPIQPVLNSTQGKPPQTYMQNAGPSQSLSQQPSIPPAPVTQSLSISYPIYNLNYMNNNYSSVVPNSTSASSYVSPAPAERQMSYY